MKSCYALLAMTFMLIGCASTPSMTDADLIDQAIMNPERTEQDRERDQRSSPDEILGLLNISPGDSAADILGGGGYYADLIAGVVRPDGQVILQNNKPYSSFVEKQLQEKYIDNKVAGITVLFSEVDDLQLEPDSLNAALMVMSFHDLYYVNPERGWNETDIDQFLGQIHTALKPGGRFVIVDHAAFANTGKSEVAKVHRIDEEFVRAEIERVGFRLVASSDALRNPADDKSKMVFDKEVRGKTDRFVLAFER